MTRLGDCSQPPAAPVCLYSFRQSAMTYDICHGPNPVVHVSLLPTAKQAIVASKTANVWPLHSHHSFANQERIASTKIMGANDEPTSRSSNEEWCEEGNTSTKTKAKSLPPTACRSHP